MQWTIAIPCLAQFVPIAFMTIISLAIIEAAGEGATYKKVCIYVSTLEKKFQLISN